MVLQERTTVNANGPLANVGEGPHLDYVDVGLDDYLWYAESGPGLLLLLRGAGPLRSAAHRHGAGRCLPLGQLA